MRPAIIGCVSGDFGLRRDVLASDAERERAAASLRRHYAAGRLDHDELEERLDEVTAARRRSELRRALSGLPSDAPVRALEHLHRLDRAALRGHAATWVGLNGGAVAIWAAEGGGGFWPAYLLAPTTALLWVHASSVRGLRRLLPPPPDEDDGSGRDRRRLRRSR